jgi:coenzyme F420-reducing hydrogenase beta subunit
MIVSAPFSGEIAKSLASPTKREITPPLWSPKRVATKPGCRQLAVTPVPCRRRASSRVKRMLQSLERPRRSSVIDQGIDARLLVGDFGGHAFHLGNAREIGVMDRVAKAGRPLVKPRQGRLSARYRR